jgi:hypothetical protein
LHLSASEGREILTRILENTPYTSIPNDPLEDIVETAPEEEPMIVELEPLATPLESSTILQVLEPPKEEEIPLLEDMFKFEEYLFSNFGNTSNYSTIRKSLAPSAPNQHLSDPTKDTLLKENMKEFTTIISNDWLIESELSHEVIHLDSPSTSISYQIHQTSFDATYNPVVGVNIMSKYFAHTLFKDIKLTPTTKLLKSLSGQILPSEGIFHFIPIKVDKTKVYLSFYIFNTWEFDLLIGNPLERIIHEGRYGSVNVHLGKSLNLSIPITESLHTKMELSPEQEPMEGIMAMSFLESSDKDLEEVAKDFIEEIEQPRNPLPLDETHEPPKSPIELKPLPSGLKYAFLNDNKESPVIISDKLSEYETI